MRTVLRQDNLQERKYKGSQSSLACRRRGSLCILHNHGIGNKANNMDLLTDTRLYPAPTETNNHKNKTPAAPAHQQNRKHTHTHTLGYAVHCVSADLNHLLVFCPLNSSLFSAYMSPLFCTERGGLDPSVGDNRDTPLFTLNPHLRSAFSYVPGIKENTSRGIHAQILHGRLIINASSLFFLQGKSCRPTKINRDFNN